MTDYWQFAYRYWKHLFFGVLLMALSSFGQTFYISLFGQHLRTDFGLSDGALGSAYAVATIASALTLTRVGRWIDRTSVERYTLGVAVLLAGACLMMALGQNVAMLIVALYLLRLGGQGLMTHTAKTTIARSFQSNRGKALSITSLGVPLSEALLPILVVSGMLLIGWRATWYVGAILVIGGALLAVHLLPRTVADAPMPLAAMRLAKSSRNTLVLWTDKRLWFSLPVLLATSFVSTGFFFHQARLIQEKGWSLAWVATCFVGFAAARAFALLVIGPIIDRYGTIRLLPYCLLPLTLSLTVLAFFSSRWAVPFYLVAMGIAGGIASIMSTSAWVELYGVAQLARVRSSVAAADVIASGLSPVAMGWLIDFGVPLSTQAIICIGGVLAVSLLSRRVQPAAEDHSTKTAPHTR